jgi:RNase P protein component
MLPKRSRLTAGEVRVVLAEGSPLRVGPYSGKYLPGAGSLKVAVIVSKKDTKTAVARNRVRRAAYRQLETLELPPQGSLALFVRPVKPKR